MKNEDKKEKEIKEVKEVRLKVVEALQDDAYKGIARIDPQIMRALGLNRGDVIAVKGQRETVAIVDRAYPADVGEGIIRIDGLARRNAKTSVGEIVVVKKANAKPATKIAIAPAQQGIAVQADPEGLKSGLLGRAFVKGDILSLGGQRRREQMGGDPFDMFGGGDMGDFLGAAFGFSGFQSIKFMVVSVSPGQSVIVTEDTEVVLHSKAVEIADEAVPDVTYEDIGGLTDEVKKIREMVELPLIHPEIFDKLGIEPPKGVLLHGPPGTGKTLLAKAVANETESNFILLNGPEIMSKFYGESEKKIRDIFDDAEKNAPSIIFIDEIDAIAPKREDVQGEVERRVVSQLLTMMDGLKSRGKVVVIGATNRINSLDPALRRPGRFDREVEISVPDKAGRLNILKIHTRNMPLEPPFNLSIANQELAEYTNQTKPESRLNHLLEEKDNILENVEKKKKRLKVVKDKALSIENEVGILKENKKELSKRYNSKNSVREQEALEISFHNLDKQIDSLNSNHSDLEEEYKETLSELKEFSKDIDTKDEEISQLRKRIVSLKKYEQEIKDKPFNEKIKEIYLFGLTPPALNKIMDIYVNYVMSKKGNLSIEKEDILGYLRGEFISNSDPRIKVLINQLSDVKFTKEVVRDIIIPKLDKKDDSDSINYLNHLIKFQNEEDLSKAVFDSLLDSDLKERLNSKFLQAMKEYLAGKTHGFVGADISALAKEAAMNLLRKLLPELKTEENKAISQEVLDKIKIGAVDFEEALKVVRPSAMREVLVETPNIGWKDIGGLENTKRDLIEAVELPIKNPEAFKRLGIRPPRGVLLYGPPGTGKTLLAKAVAKESEANFIQVKGPSLLSMWVGKSEEGVRKIFERARQVAPCIIFFDEIDSLAGKRGLDMGNKVTERVLNQLLAEMDGLEDLKDITIIGATNRPDMLDGALMRPGRFDRIILVDVPDLESRKKIFEVHLKNTPIDKNVNVDEMVILTEGFVGADIEGLVREASMTALRRDINSKVVTKEDFDEAFKRVKSSVSPETAKRYKKMEEYYLKSAKAGLEVGPIYTG